MNILPGSVGSSFGFLSPLPPFLPFPSLIFADPAAMLLWAASFSLPCRHSLSVPCVAAALPLKAAYLGLPFAGCETFGGSHHLSVLPLFKTVARSQRKPNGKWI